jgi:hypothetical protein
VMGEDQRDYCYFLGVPGLHYIHVAGYI